MRACAGMTFSERRPGTSHDTATVTGVIVYGMQARGTSSDAAGLSHFPPR
jgi:hypothetical protein